MAPRSASPLFVEVAVPLPIDHPFTYRVPPGQEGRARVGVRVLAPFGPRKVTGLITALVDGSALAGRAARDVLAFLDEEPYVSPRQLDFLSAAARECLAPLGEMLRAALPRGLPRREAPPAPRTETFFRAEPAAAGEKMTPKQRAVYEAVAAAGELPSSLLSERVPGGAEAARRMVSRGYLHAAVRE